MIHFPNASLANGAMMRAIRFDAAALRTLEDDLTFAETKTLDVFFGGVAARNRALIGKLGKLSDLINNLMILQDLWSWS